MGGDKVTRFQKALKLAVPLEVTGTFDDATTEAVKKFQGMKGLGQDGVVGNITFAHLWADNFWNKGIVSDLRGPEFYACMPQDMEIQVSIKTQRAYLMDSHSGEVVREYPVATGKSPYNTPTGSYRITEIKEKPSWYPPKSGWAKGASVAKPCPGNPLGPVKMRLGDTSVLFHGVPPHEYSSIGKGPASHGCMRMFPQDAWELHTLIKSGTRVTISK
jgi:murein L,D-transpeptidase YcbB/YkuD